MHPTISHSLVRDRQQTLRAEAEQARLATIARAHSREMTPSGPAPQPSARTSLVRRLVARLATA